MTDVDKLGMVHVMERAREIAGVERAADSRVVRYGRRSTRAKRPAPERRSKADLSYREAHLVMEMLSDSGQLGSIEMVEINPILDNKNQTATLAVGLICSALGKSIL